MRDLNKRFRPPKQLVNTSAAIWIWNVFEDLPRKISTDFIAFPLRDGLSSAGLVTDRHKRYPNCFIKFLNVCASHTFPILWVDLWWRLWLVETSKRETKFMAWTLRGVIFIFLTPTHWNLLLQRHPLVFLWFSLKLQLKKHSIPVWCIEVERKINWTDHKIVNLEILWRLSIHHQFCFTANM